MPKKQSTTAEPFDPALRAGMHPPEFRRRNKMSKTEYFRRKQRQAAGEPGSELLLPERIQISPQRELITFAAEMAWQNANAVGAVTQGRKRAASRSEAR